MRIRLAAMVLAFEAITVALALPVATDAARPLTFVAVLCVLTAAVLRRPGGFIVAWTVQILLLALILIVHAFAFVAVPYVLLWWYCTRIGSRIDRERLHAATSSESDRPAD